MAESLAQDDILDQILNNYDRSVDDILDSADQRSSNLPSNGKSQNQIEIPEGLGIDTEVKVQKTRKPVPKLDETRLRSSLGVPKLQKIVKAGFKFRGKGHEFSDVATLLGTYQLWLDALHPRSKFADGLAMIEKLGHQKSIQILRSEWINDAKPSGELDDADRASSDGNISEAAYPGNVGRTSSPQRSSNILSPEATLQSATDAHATRQAKPTPSVGMVHPVMEDSTAGGPDNDELDALLAEQGETSSFGAEARNSSTQAPTYSAAEREEFDDDFAAEEEMMREMDFFD